MLQLLNTMLWNAVASSDVTLAKKWRKAGASVHIKGPDDGGVGMPAVMLCMLFQTAMSPFLLFSAMSLTLNTVQECSLLAIACKQGSLPMVQFLLRCGAKAKVCSGTSSTLLDVMTLMISH